MKTATHAPLTITPGSVPAPLAEPVFLYVARYIVQPSPRRNPGKHCPGTFPGADNLTRLSGVATIQLPASLPLSTPPPVYLARKRPGNSPGPVGHCRGCPRNQPRPEGVQPAPVAARPAGSPAAAPGTGDSLSGERNRRGALVQRSHGDIPGTGQPSGERIRNRSGAALASFHLFAP